MDAIRALTDGRRWTIAAILAISALSALPSAACCAEQLETPVLEAVSIEDLSGDGAKIVAHHLTAVMNRLQQGGPPVGPADFESDKIRHEQWTPEMAIRKFYGQPQDDYSSEQYLTEYRNSFLDKWRKQLTGCVSRRPNGEILISQGDYSTCCFQSAGTTNGFYDAQGLVHCLMGRAEMEKSSREVNAMDNGGESERDAGTPYHEAAVFLFSHFAEKTKSESCPAQETGTRAGRGRAR